MNSKYSYIRVLAYSSCSCYTVIEFTWTDGRVVMDERTHSLAGRATWCSRGRSACRRSARATGAATTTTRRLAASRSSRTPRTSPPITRSPPLSSISASRYPLSKLPIVARRRRTACCNPRSTIYSIDSTAANYRVLHSHVCTLLRLLLEKLLYHHLCLHCTRILMLCTFSKLCFHITFLFLNHYETLLFTCSWGSLCILVLIENTQKFFLLPALLL